MVFIDDKQSLKSAKHDFETAYIQQVIEANDCRLRKGSRSTRHPLLCSNE